MKRAEILQEIRIMRFEEAYDVWTEKRLSQEEAARILGVCDRTFRRLHLIVTKITGWMGCWTSV